MTHNLPQLLLFSANTQDSLHQQVINNTRYLEKYPDRVFDMAYTLNQRREHHVYRTFCIVGSDGAMGKMATMIKVPSITPDIVMVFSGQGAQWPTMAKELILTNLDFRCDIRAVDNILQSLQYPPAWYIEGQSRFSQILHISIVQLFHLKPLWSSLLDLDAC